MRTDNKSGWSRNRKNFSTLISKRWETPRITTQASRRVGGRHTCHKPPDFFERSNYDYHFWTGYKASIQPQQTSDHQKYDPRALFKPITMGTPIRDEVPGI